MRPKDIIAKTFQFEDTGYVPQRIDIYGGVQDRLDEHYGGRQWRDKIVNYLFGFHSVGDCSTDAGDGCNLSSYGYTTREPLSHLEKPTFDKPSMDGFTWPDPETLGDWDGLAKLYKEHEGKFRLCGMCYGWTERASFMRGVENLLMDMIENPQFVHDLFDGYLELRLKLLEMIIDRIPIEGIFDGGDDCDQRGPMMGRAMWNEFVGPRLKAVIDFAHSKGLPVVAHMCGNVMPIVPDLLDMKLDVLESLQPECMDVYELKRITHGKMALIGGMGTQQMLPFGTPDEVTAETKKLARELGNGSGYVLSSAKSVMEDVPTANAVAYLEACLAEDKFFELGGEL